MERVASTNFVKCSVQSLGKLQRTKRIDTKFSILLSTKLTCTLVYQDILKHVLLSQYI